MKSKTVAALLAFFLGGLGVHKFYLGKNGQGILYLVFCWTYIPSIIAFVEAIKFLTMNDDEFRAKYGKQGYSAPSYTSEPESYQVDEQSQNPTISQIQDPSSYTETTESVGMKSSFSQAQKMAASIKAKQPQNN